MALVAVYIRLLVTLEFVQTVTYGFAIALAVDKQVKVDRMILARNSQARTKDIGQQYPSVYHYARHGLCRTFKGKHYLYKAMKTKLCGMKRSFVASFVIDLCRHKNRLLDKWVAELFDIDEDGYITHFERNIYVVDD
ncbi:uncharacterized protein LOC123539019 [Mercenaria mercenaria]|uniref:uncharacterized protein LOC123539019 n=1 Tax=Mercenaria mercenaria TaxID=6596 RepID=UPI00234F5F3D|nr:uncharacterized protein LOC123539019 [Mercenaria mercenaria]